MVSTDAVRSPKWSPGLSPQAITKGRTALGESRKIFGRRFGVNDEAVRRWEMGINTPRPEMQRELVRVLTATDAPSTVLDRARAALSTELKRAKRDPRGAKKSRSGNTGRTRSRANLPTGAAGRPQPLGQLPGGARGGSGKLSSAEWIAAVEATGRIVSTYITEAVDGNKTADDVAAMSRTVLDRLIGSR